MKLGPAGKEEGRKLVLWVIQSSCLPQQLEVNRYLETWTYLAFWLTGATDPKKCILDCGSEGWWMQCPEPVIICAGQHYWKKSTSNQVRNWNGGIFPLTCSSNTVKSYESIKTCGCPREDSFPSIRHKPSNAIEPFFLCLTKRHGTGLEVILLRWEYQFTQLITKSRVGVWKNSLYLSHESTEKIGKTVSPAHC